MLLKIICVVLFCNLLVCCRGDELDSYESSEECDEFLEGENGTSEHHSLVTTTVTFFLLTPDNETIELNSTNLNLVNKTNPTKIIVHGLGNYEDYTWIDQMASVYHTHGDYNVIAVDWLVVSEKDSDYLVTAVDEVGNEVGTLIMEITETDVDYLSDIHLIGSSVGAQISGAAGETVAKETNSKVGRITGLSPGDLDILDVGDADFVDVIHTSVFVGQKQLGTVDFYVIDGLDQPICLNENDNGTKSTNSTNKIYIADDNGIANNNSQDDLCGELVASDLYIESIEYATRYTGVSCYNASEAIAKLCDKANSQVMGEYVSRNASGNYVVVKSAAARTQGKYILSGTIAILLWYLTV